MNLFNQHISKKTDQELVEFYCRTDNWKYLEVLFERYMHLVYGLCLKYLKNRMNSQDAVMEIFALVATKLKSSKVTYFKSWLYIVSKNHCLMILRKESKKAEVFLPLNMEMDHEDPLNDELDMDLEFVEECLKELRNKQKNCISLFYLESMSYGEIAKKEGWSLKEVKSAIQNGKRNLKTCIEGKRKKN